MNETIEKEFPPQIWWGGYVKNLFETQHSQPYQQGPTKQKGIERAIIFFNTLDQKR